MSISSRSLPWAPAPGCRLALVVSLATTAALSLLVAGVAHAAAPETPATTFAASASAAGELADGAGVAEFTPVGISEDGRYVAFQSASQNLGEAGPAGAVEGFVKDLETGEVELVSRADGVGGAPAAAPGITTLELSGDGRYVVFTSAATNLGTPLPGEEAGETHVYRRDLETGETTLVDRVSGVGGQILARGAEGDSISADGGVVAFTDRVANLEDPVGDHTETVNPVGYVRDLETGTTAAISRASGAAGELADEAAETLSLSPDGRYVAFGSRADNLVPGAGGEGWEQVYLRDTGEDITTLLSQNALGEPGETNSSFPSVSGGEGCFVEFSSTAQNLLRPASGGVGGEQVFRADDCAATPSLSLVSRGASGIAPTFGQGAYRAPGVSADGEAAVFAAEFSGSRCCHLYLRDLAAGTTTTLDRASGESGASANGELEYFAISANGCRAAFESRATNLGAGTAPDPGEEPTEVYVRQIAPCAGTGSGEPGAGGGSGGGDGGSGETPGSGDSAGGGGSGGGSTDGSSSDAPSGSVAGATAKPALRSVTVVKRRLVAVASGPGPVTVTIRRRASGSRRGWKLVRTIHAAANAAGRVSVVLPRLRPGHYRLEVHLRGAPAQVRGLTVRRGGHL